MRFACGRRAMVAQAYELRPVPRLPVELDPLITLCPRYGVRVTLRQRRHSRSGEAQHRCPRPSGPGGGRDERSACIDSTLPRHNRRQGWHTGAGHPSHN
jgi:hypothetical protein